VWQNGVEVFGSRLHARFQLACDLQIQAEFAKTAGDKVDFDRLDKLTIVGGSVSSRQCVIDKVDGVEGSFASLTGGSVPQFFKTWQPLVVDELRKTFLLAVENACREPQTCSDISTQAAKLETARLRIAHAQNNSPSPIVPVANSERSVAPSLAFEFSVDSSL